MTTNKNRNYKKGYERERKLVVQDRNQGHLAFRSAGSHSPIDVFVLDPEKKIIRLIQCKPKSMPLSQREKILKELEKYLGMYEIRTVVW